MLQTDINCDMGEEVGNEVLLMPFISSANIACGYHAGNEDEMKRVVDLCLQYGVAIGAHPSFPDKENFGRTNMQLSPKEIDDIVSDQLSNLHTIVIKAGGQLHHVKPHGALYNMAAADTAISATIANAVKAFNPGLIYYGLSGSVMISEAQKIGLRTASEVFADRTYQANGTLTPRSQPNALITDKTVAMQQVMTMIREQKVTTADGQYVPIQADTICIHGDGANAVMYAKSIYEALSAAGIAIRSV